MVAARVAVDLSPAVLPRDDLVEEALLSELAFDDADLTGREARLVEIAACRLISTRLAGSRLEKANITDSVFERCDLANVELSHGAMSRVEVVGSRLTGLVAPAVQLRHVSFRDCLVDLSSFRFATFSGVEFVDCRLRRADFVSADLRGAVFRRCDLGEVELSQAKARGAVFVDCSWDGIRGITSLSGASIATSSPVDAVAFTHAMAQGLGITLADPADFAEET